MSAIMVLVPNEIWQIYKELGSLGKVRQALIDSGLSNPETGKPFSRMGILYALRRCPQYRDFDLRRKTRANMELKILQQGDLS